MVEFPAGWVVESLVTVDGEAIEWPPTVTTASDGGQRYMWRRAHLPALIGAPGDGGADQLVTVAVRLRSATLSSGRVVEGPADAEGLSRFEAELIGPPVVSPPLRALASKILEAAGQPNEMSADDKAAHLYAWTKEQIAYCSIAVGLGGWIPHEPERVEAARYGDCKDKANLLRALLASVDIRSRLVGIYAGGAPRPFGLPVLGANFNHMILEIQLEDGVVYVDPTTRTVPFGELPAADKGRLCLPLDPAGASLVLTPSTSPKADRVVSTWTLTLLSDGRFMGRVRSILNGSFADSARDDYVTMPPRLLPRAMRRWVGGRGTLSNVVVYGGPPPLRRAPLIAQAQFYSDADARAATGPYGTLSAMEILTAGGFAIDDRRRASPFEIGAQSGREDKVELHLPKGIRVVRIPPPLTVTSPYVSAVVRWEVENAGEDVVLRLTRELNYTAERVPAEDVAGFREDHQRYLSALEARVVFASPDGS